MKLFVWITDTDEVMRKFLKEFRVGFCGTDIHHAVDLHGIGTDNFVFPVRAGDEGVRSSLPP